MAGVEQNRLSQIYREDFSLWIEETLEHLAARELDDLDWEHLILEVGDLGRSQKRELESRFGTLLYHLLKRCYVPFPDCLPEYPQNWLKTIAEQRRELQLLLKQSPSLRNYCREVWQETWDYAIAQVRQEYPDLHFPHQWEFSSDIDSLLTQNFW